MGARISESSDAKVPQQLIGSLKTAKTTGQKHQDAVTKALAADEPAAEYSKPKLTNTKEKADAFLKDVQCNKSHCIDETNLMMMMYGWQHGCTEKALMMRGTVGAYG